MILEQFQLKVTAFAGSRKERRRFMKFAVVGAIGALVDFAVLNFMLLVVGLVWYVAATIGIGAAVVSNFTWNRLWSFPESRSRPVLAQFGQFALINVVGLGINLGIMTLMMNVFLPLVGVPHPLDVNVAKATAIGVVLFWNFGVNRLWTYKGL